ncbi:MAG: hypothetical protein O3B13_17355 [Planctomycetota bacterium]|nr:hypothetical protein [Planctomycetota bacterium]
MSQASASTTSSVSDVEELSPVLSEMFALTRGQVLVVFCFVLSFLYYSYMPLYFTDIWGHVSYGEWIIQNRTLPAEDPFLELASGVPITCTAWLGQVVFGLANQHGGAEWVSNIFALTVMVTWATLIMACFVRSASMPSAIMCSLLCCFAAWSRHAIVRPEIFGSLCFALLLLVTVCRETRIPGGEKHSRTRAELPFYLGVAVLFACWANLHGSFVVGFAVLGCQFLGRAIECLMKRQPLRETIHDRDLRHWLIACEVAVAASLLNPYGMDLLIHTVLFPSNPNLKDVLEWYSLEMVSYEGIQIGISWIVLAVLLRHSRVSFRPADVLMLCVFTLAVVLRVRMQMWYAAVLAVVMAPHAADILNRWRLGDIQFLQGRSFNNSLVALLIIWLGFSFSPVSTGVLGGSERHPDKLFSRGTPVALTAWLREHPPQGQIMNPQWWGDWLVEFGPPDLQVFMTTNAVHAAPQQVWKDYLTLARSDQGFEPLLDRYRINTIIVHKELQALTAPVVRQLAGWKIIYEDDVGLVACRNAVLDQMAESDHSLAAYSLNDSNPRNRSEVRSVQNKESLE